MPIIRLDPPEKRWKSQTRAKRKMMCTFQGSHMVKLDT